MAGDYTYCESNVDYAAFVGTREGSGTFAQVVVKPSWLLPRIPDGVSYEHATMAIAQEAGIGPAIEPLNRFEAYFLNTIGDAAEHVQRVDHPNLGVMYDTFHANIEEKDPVACIATHIDVIRHVHISENDRGTPGRGHVPWAETFKALRAGGYDGWLTIEAFGRALPELAATTCVWRDLSGSEEEVYTEGLRLIQEGWATDGTSAGTSAA